jgi:hypothetical protein
MPAQRSCSLAATLKASAPMNLSETNRCLALATVSLLAIGPIGSAAQEEEGQQRSEPPIEQPAPPQRLFVSDKLVLNVYAEADPNSSRVATIETGDGIEEIERADNMVHVRLQDGRDGWVGANYLTNVAPASVRLRELQREQKSIAPGPDKKALEEIARLKKESAILQAQVNELKSKAAISTADAVEAEEEDLVPAPLAAAPAPSSNAGWVWALVAALGTGLGFAAGYQTLARRIRKKFGGLRIH